MCIQKLNRRDRSFEDELNSLCDELRSYDNEYIQNILFDLDGQVKALNMTMDGK